MGRRRSHIRRKDDEGEDSRGEEVDDEEKERQLESFLGVACKTSEEARGDDSCMGSLAR